MPTGTRAVKTLATIRGKTRLYNTGFETRRYKQKRNRGRSSGSPAAPRSRSQLAINLGIRDQMVEDAVNKRGGR